LSGQGHENYDVSAACGLTGRRRIRFSGQKNSGRENFFL